MLTPPPRELYLGTGPDTSRKIQGSNRHLYQTGRVCKKKNKKSRWLTDFFPKKNPLTITPLAVLKESGANKANMVRKARPGLDQTTGTIEE